MEAKEELKIIEHSNEEPQSMVLAEEKGYFTRIIEDIKRWARKRSLWVLHMNTGSCNGCDIEILASLTPRLDAERFGVKLVGSPRHADILICTGGVTWSMEETLRRTYAQMPDPKFVVVIGSCGSTGGVFEGAYGIRNGVDKVIPVDLYVPGCPPKPEAIIFGIAKLIEALEASK
jgi:NADH-quinone oxidoreductase B subunit